MWANVECSDGIYTFPFLYFVIIILRKTLQSSNFLSFVRTFVLGDMEKRTNYQDYSTDIMQ